VVRHLRVLGDIKQVLGRWMRDHQGRHGVGVIPLSGRSA
jgi:hypothetical protein